MVFLWVTRDLFFVDGWGAWFKKGYASDTTPAIFILMFLVLWPKNNIFKSELIVSRLKMIEIPLN